MQKTAFNFISDRLETQSFLEFTAKNTDHVDVPSMPELTFPTVFSD